MKQIIVLKEYASMKTAQAFCARIDPMVQLRFKGKVQLGCNEVDAGCVQVELTGEFGQEIFLADLLRT
jgi:hypothetical protein